MLTISSEIKKTFNWLNAENAKKIMDIARKYSPDSIKRVAQERGALGYCKVIVSFNRISWARSLEDSKPFFEEIKNSGLVNSLTYQN